MQNQVFTIQQMQTLKEKGLKDFKASMCWMSQMYNDVDKTWEHHHLELHSEGFDDLWSTGKCIPTMTAVDALLYLAQRFNPSLGCADDEEGWFCELWDPSINLVRYYVDNCSDPLEALYKAILKTLEPIIEEDE